MAAGLLLPEDVGPVDAARVVTFLNAVADAATLASTVGFSEGPAVAALVAGAILARRATAPFTALAQVMEVTGVTPARFTEIVVALSGARPPRPAAGYSVRFHTTPAQPLLGQPLALVAQLLDPTGAGVAGITLTCVSTWGTLTGRAGLAEQHGTSAAMVTEPGGLLRLRLDPPILPALAADARAALDAELTQLGLATSAADTARALAAFADHYRAEAAGDLRSAIDRLVETFPTEAQTTDAGWTVVPVTLIAFAGDEAASVVGLTTIAIRNWLPAFIAALRDAITGDRRMDDALANIPLDQMTGGRLARDIFGAQYALAGLEQGVLGQKFGQDVASAGVGRFLDAGTRGIDAAALVDATRAAGTAATAIGSGGFATFDAINAVRQVDDTISGRAGLLAGLDGRLSTVETAKADASVVDALANTLRQDNAALAGRVSSIEVNAVSKTDLAALDSRITQMAAVQVTQADLRTLTTRVGQIETNTATKADLAAMNTRIGRLETIQITRADLTALENQITQRMTTDIATATAGLRGELNTRIDAKADQTTVAGLQRSVTTLQADTTRISTRVDAVDTRVTVLNNNRIIRP